jgi:hypothetical protein
VGLVRVRGRLLTVAPNYRDQPTDSRALAEQLRASLQTEINAITDPAPIGWWLIWKGSKAYNVWEYGTYANGKPRQKTKRNRTPGLWEKQEYDRDRKRDLQTKLNTIEQLLGTWQL